MKNTIAFSIENVAFHITDDVLTINQTASPSLEKFYQTTEYIKNQLTAEFTVLFHHFLEKHKSDFYANAPTDTDQIPTALALDLFTDFLRTFRGYAP